VRSIRAFDRSDGSVKQGGGGEVPCDEANVTSGTERDTRTI
jgi:hypothetical protein